MMRGCKAAIMSHHTVIKPDNDDDNGYDDNDGDGHDDDIDTCTDSTDMGTDGTDTDPGAPLEEGKW